MFPRSRKRVCAAAAAMRHAHGYSHPPSQTLPCAGRHGRFVGIRKLRLEGSHASHQQWPRQAALAACLGARASKKRRKTARTGSGVVITSGSFLGFTGQPAPAVNLKPMMVRIMDYLTRRFPRATSDFFEVLIPPAVIHWVTGVASWAPVGQTIGERIRRRAQQAFSLIIGGLVLFVVAFAWRSSGVFQTIVGFVLVIAGCAAFFRGLHISVTLECPKCENTVNPWIFGVRQPKRCPHCRVSLEEPYPH